VRGGPSDPRGPCKVNREHPFGLTTREIEIVRALDQGLRNAEIGERLHISPKTVGHSYVSQDKRKICCIYDGPSPEAIRKVAERNKLPVDRTEVRVLDPYFHM
jgi:hypothetical protein